MANISKIKVGNTSYGITATPTAHASTATTYGAASASKYGHVKLSDNYKSSAGAAASGIGASSAAVYNVYNTLNSNLANLTTKVVYPSHYDTILDTASLAVSLNDFLTLKGVSYTIDDVWAVIPVGARKSGSNTLYPATFDGINIRCNAAIGAVLKVYIFHAIEV